MRPSNNIMKGWDALLDGHRGPDSLSIYAAPARATDLSNLPPSFFDLGSNETFREENREYCRRLWRGGVPCELRGWPGAYYGFDGIAPASQLAIECAIPRMAWLGRLLGTSASE